MSIPKRTPARTVRSRNLLCAVCVGLVVLSVGTWLTVRQFGRAASSSVTPLTAARQAADLGLILQSCDDRDGVYVLAVMDQGAASEAGIRAGDTILSVDGASLTSAADFNAALPQDAGTALTLTLARGGDELMVTLTP